MRRRLRLFSVSGSTKRLGLLPLVGPDVLGTVERRAVGGGHLHRDPNPPTHPLPSGNLYVRTAEAFMILNLIFV